MKLQNYGSLRDTLEYKRHEALFKILKIKDNYHNDMDCQMVLMKRTLNVNQEYTDL